MHDGSKEITYGGHGSIQEQAQEGAIVTSFGYGGSRGTNAINNRWI